MPFQPGMPAIAAVAPVAVRPHQRSRRLQPKQPKLIPRKNLVLMPSSILQLLELALWLREREDEAVEFAERGRQLADALTFDHLMDQAVEAICRQFPAPK